MNPSTSIPPNTEFNLSNDAIPPYSIVLVKLLQSVIYDEDRKLWNLLITYQHQIRQYFATIGVELHLNEQEGFAFLSQPEEIDTETNKTPRLVRRMPLSYEVTLLCVVLREALEEFDVRNTESRKLFITNQDLKERIELFFKDKADKVRLLQRFDTYINSVVSLGFLKEVKVRGFDDQLKTYEVMRVIKAKVSNEILEQIREKMEKGVKK
ncbi:MAG: DUF4194 domain-containing protein [Chitinophagales bacterium]